MGRAGSDTDRDCRTARGGPVGDQRAARPARDDRTAGRTRHRHIATSDQGGAGDGAEAIQAGAPARRYDNLAVLTTAVLGFALGAGTVEGFKHLRRAELGPVAGITMVPELATRRSRLRALTDGSDPLALQQAFAAGMLAFDPAEICFY